MPRKALKRSTLRLLSHFRIGIQIWPWTFVKDATIKQGKTVSTPEIFQGKHALCQGKKLS